MRFRALPVTSLEDATLDFEQLQSHGIFDTTPAFTQLLAHAILDTTSAGGALSGTYPNPALVPVTGAAWITPTLINAWVAYGLGTEPPAYLKDPLGFVHIRGSIKSGASGSQAFLLPAGFRPVGDAQYPAVGPGPTTAWVAIQASSGAVSPFFTSAGFVSMSGITFLAEN